MDRKTGKFNPDNRASVSASLGDEEQRRQDEKIQKKPEENKDIRVRGTVKSSELSKRWESICWPRVFDGSSLQIVYLSICTYRKDLLFTFDPCPSGRQESRVIPRCGVVTCIDDVLQYVHSETNNAITKCENQLEQHQPTDKELWVLKPSGTSMHTAYIFRTRN